MKADGEHPTELFTYGTLQPGAPRWPLLAPFAEGTSRAAEVVGHLFDTGHGYPAATFGDADGAGPIPGTLVPLAAATIERALAVLDDVEGTEYGLYHRVAVTTTDGQQVWAYAWSGDTTDLTPIPRWG